MQLIYIGYRYSNSKDDFTENFSINSIILNLIFFKSQVLSYQARTFQFGTVEYTSQISLKFS